MVTVVRAILAWPASPKSLSGGQIVRGPLCVPFGVQVRDSLMGGHDGIVAVDAHGVEANRLLGVSDPGKCVYAGGRDDDGEVGLIASRQRRCGMYSLKPTMSLAENIAPHHSPGWECSS